MVILPNFPPPNFPAIRYCVSFELLLNQNFSPLCATFGETAHFDIIILIQPTFLLYALIKPHNLFTPLATSHNTLCDQWAGSKHGQTVSHHYLPHMGSKSNSFTDKSYSNTDT